MPSTSELSPIASQQGTATPAGDPGQVGLQPFDVLKRHWKLAVGVALAVGLAGGVALHMRMKPLYEATAIVYVSPIFPTALADDHDHLGQYDAFLEQQITAVTRYETLQKALHALPDAWPPQWPEEPEQSRIIRLQRAMKVGQVGHSYEASITVESEQKEHLAEFVNKITEEYLADARNEEVYGRDQKLATLTQERADLKKQLDDAFAQQSQLLRDVGMAHFDGSGGTNPYDDSLGKLRDELGSAHEKSAEADSQYRAMGSGNLSNPVLLQTATEEVAHDAGVQGITAQLRAKKAQNMAAMLGMKPANPQYAQIEADNLEIDQRIDQLNREAVRKAETQIVDRLRSAKTQANTLESQLTGDMGKLTAQASTATPRLQQAAALTDQEARIQALLGVVETRIQNVSLEGDSPGSVHLFSRALPPGGPVKRKTAMAYGALLFACLVSGVMAAFMADKLDPHIYTSLDVRRLVGFPPIGLLLNRTEFSPELQKEYFLRLAGGLDQAHRRTGARTFVFPPVGPKSSGEIVEKLGAELAANGLRVLVVHVMPTPGHERAHGAGTPVDAHLTPSPRLLTVTDGSAQLSTEVDKEPIRVISLPAAEVAELLRRSRSYYNAILVAADPLFTSAYTEHFARTADGTVLIVESGETRKDELVRAARLLERLKIAGIAIVLDGVTEKRAEEDVARQIAEYRKSAA
jgi:uncharacterized protein involved in exopolysaccharide biosynthesis